MIAHLLKAWAEDNSLSYEDQDLLRKSADQIENLGERALDLKIACQEMISIIVRHLGDDLHYPEDTERLNRAKIIAKWSEHPDSPTPTK